MYVHQDLAQGCRIKLSGTAWTSEGPSRWHDWLCEWSRLKNIEALEISALTYNSELLCFLVFANGNQSAFEYLPSLGFLLPLILSFLWDMYCSLLISVLLAIIFLC